MKLAPLQSIFFNSLLPTVTQLLTKAGFHLLICIESRSVVGGFDVARLRLGWIFVLIQWWIWLVEGWWNIADRFACAITWLGIANRPSEKSDFSVILNGAMRLAGRQPRDSVAVDPSICCSFMHFSRRFVSEIHNLKNELCWKNVQLRFNATFNRIETTSELLFNHLKSKLGCWWMSWRLSNLMFVFN